MSEKQCRSQEQGESLRANWKPMQMEFLGNAAQIVQVGNGKTTIATGDPGEPKKVTVKG